MSASASYDLIGRLDGFTSAAHEAELRALLGGDAQSLLINLGQLEYISSAGLRVLLMTAKLAKAKGGTVVLAAPTATVREVLTISGFDKIFEIRD
jgi:anti-anti-sigma factor